MNWLKSLLQRRQTQPAEQHDLQNELQTLRLELAEQSRELDALKASKARETAAQQERIESEAEARLELIVQEMASAVAQLSVQNYLLMEQGKPVAGADVMAVAQRIVRTLEQHGMEIAPQPGEMMAFDANRHLPLSAGQTIQSGQMVVVRFPGVWFRGKMLAKAQVEQKSA